jgi:hypothetical protein
LRLIYWTPVQKSARKDKSAVLPLLTKSITYVFDFGNPSMGCTVALNNNQYFPDKPSTNTVNCCYTQLHEQQTKK